MNKIVKIILIALGVLVGLFIITLIGLKLYFTTERLKQIVIPRAEKMMQRNLEVGGLSLKVFPKLAIQMEDIRISNPQGISFAQDHFLTVDELVLDVDVMPLLRRELKINEITLRQPSIYLELNRDGAANYEFPKMEAQAEPEKPAEQAKKQEFNLFLSNLQVINGELEYVNFQKDQRALIKGYQQKTQA
ncbi:MAG: AsmA family protein, partial [bacterium]